MSTLLSIGALLAAIALLWAGFRKLSWRSPAAAILSVLDLFALALAIFQLGWLGLGLFVVLNALGFVGWGLAGAIYVQAELSGAKAFNATDPECTEHVNKMLQQRDELKVLGRDGGLASSTFWPSAIAIHAKSRRSLLLSDCSGRSRTNQISNGSSSALTPCCARGTPQQRTP